MPYIQIKAHSLPRAGEGPFPHSHGSLSANSNSGTPIASFSSRKQQYPGAVALY